MAEYTYRFEKLPSLNGLRVVIHRIMEEEDLNGGEIDCLERAGSFMVDRQFAGEESLEEMFERAKKAALEVCAEHGRADELCVQYNKERQEHELSNSRGGSSRDGPGFYAC